MKKEEKANNDAQNTQNNWLCNMYLTDIGRLWIVCVSFWGMNRADHWASHDEYQTMNIIHRNVT